MPEPNITYLLGAGASYNALPVSQNMQSKIKEFICWIEQFEVDNTPFSPQDSILITKREAQLKFVKDLNWLSSNIDPFKPIDQFASKLYEKNERDFQKLKATLSCYFLLEQARNDRKNIDERYRYFFAEFRNNNMLDKLPHRVKIISWNYDLQFEKALLEFYPGKDIVFAQNHLQVISSTSSNEPKPKEFSIVKLNGTAGLHTYRDNRDKLLGFQNIVIKDNTDTELIEECLRIYALYLYSGLLVPYLNFAFEKNNELTKRAFEFALQIAKQTDELIVIGYSFPDDNREVDKNLLKSMTNLSKIYIQNPDYAIETKIQSILETSKTEMYEYIQCLDSFFIQEDLFPYTNDSVFWG
ncbi:MAG: SIR2 family protein [Ignavibacteriales bacterium]|nr:SIR2 family protein [Ignavibacteriales bacterium]